MSDSDFLEDDIKKAEAVFSSFHGVYLLLSSDKHTYVGYTVDPARRLRQHNGGTLRGGAKATTGKGPWEMILIIHGFPNEIYALGFEWAWQNLSVSRRLKEIVGIKKRGESGLQYRLRGLAHMLRVGPWCRLGLTIRWLCQEQDQPFPSNLQPPNHMPIAYGPVTLKSKLLKKKIVETQSSTQTASLTETQQTTQVVCDNCWICQKVMDSDFVKCLNPSCEASWHLICIGDEFLAQIYPSQYLLPVEGKCSSCDSTLIWSQLIENFIVHSARIKKRTENK